MGILTTVESWVGHWGWERSIPTHCAGELLEALWACTSPADPILKLGPFLWRTSELVVGVLSGLCVGLFLGLYLTCAGAAQVTCAKRSVTEHPVSQHGSGEDGSGGQARRELGDSPLLVPLDWRCVSPDRTREQDLPSVRGRSRGRRGAVA